MREGKISRALRDHSIDSTHWAQISRRRACHRSIVASVVVVFRQSVMRARENKFFMQATVGVAIDLLSLAIEMLKVQFDYSLIVEIGRKVMRGNGSCAAHVNDSISYFRREMVNVISIPRLVVLRSTGAPKNT